MKAFSASTRRRRNLYRAVAFVKTRIDLWDLAAPVKRRLVRRRGRRPGRNLSLIYWAHHDRPRRQRTARQRPKLRSGASPITAASEGSTAPSSQGDLRGERDRFVALAFCAADILLELDPNLVVVYAAGATKVLTGAAPDDITGRPFLNIVVSDERDALRDALLGADGGGRIGELAVRLTDGSRDSPPVGLSGYHLPDMNGHYFLALRMGMGGKAEFGDRRRGRDTESGLFDRESFTDLAKARLARGADDPYRLTLLRLEDMAGLRGRLDAEGRRSLAATLGTCLRAASLDGDSAARFDDEHYGVLHGLGADIEGLKRQIETYSTEADPAGRGVTANALSVDIDLAEMSETELAKAMVYAINRFCDDSDGAGAFTLGKLSAGLDDLMQDTVTRIGRLKQAIEAKAFDVAFQPIVDLGSLRPHHFEALVRMRDDEIVSHAYEFVTFAEDTGIICEFDLAMCARVLDWMAETSLQGHKHVVAVNLSGHSLASPDFVAKLHALLKTHSAAGPNLMFELTESAKIKDLDAVNRVIASLRAAGHQVCLDDFGAGAAAFRYLRALEVDVVKIDGAYVRNARESLRGRAFLKAMAGLCHDLGIATVGEMVEDETTADILRDCGLRYGQGYLFGRPSTNIGAFEAARTEIGSLRPLRRADR